MEPWQWTMEIVLLITVAIILIPMAWMIFVSLQPATGIINPRFTASFSLESYIELFSSGTPYLQQMGNSALIVAGTVLLSLGAGSLGGYALSGFRVPRGITFPLLGVAGFISIVPPMVLVPGLYVTLASLGLIGGNLGLVLANTVFQLPFAILVMKVNFDGVPRSLREAALIDGASEFEAFWRIILPLARPGLASVAVFTGVMAWNEFQFGLTMTSGGSTSPLTVGIASLVNPNQVAWGQLAAIGVVAALPIVILSLVANRQLVAGLTQGSVKG
ncbi:MAG: transporter permease [Glaciihabitans sp.]|nr:transporter permease [Glaciihabitans sp.]